MKPRTTKLLATAALSTGAMVVEGCWPLPGITGHQLDQDAADQADVGTHDAAADGARPEDAGTTRDGDGGGS